MNIDFIKHFGIDRMNDQSDVQKIAPDVSAVKFSNGNKNFVAVMTDYFDEDDIKNGFPDKIRQLFGVRQVTFIASDHENSGVSDMARNLAVPNNGHGWVLLAEVR